MALFTVTLEEHFLSTNADDGRALPASSAKAWAAMRSKPAWMSELRDISPSGTRIKAMDEGHIDIQVLSNSFGVDCTTPDFTRTANNQLAAAIAAQPRFKGFAALPMKYPQEAAGELERCIKELGFLGTLIDSHLDDGRYFDSRAFWPVFAKAQELDVPVYIHPTTPTENVQTSLYDGNYDNSFAVLLGISAFGWHSDTALSVLRMYGAGVFQEFPRLKIIVGHMGEMLPFMLDRIDEKLDDLWSGAAGGGDGLTFREMWARNVWVTTSGMFTMAPMACLVRSMPLEHIMYSVDYPYSQTTQGHKFLCELKESGMVTEKELEMIAHGNAQKLLRL